MKKADMIYDLSAIWAAVNEEYMGLVFAGISVNGCDLAL